MNDLAGLTALVTGAAGGIGLATARLLAGRGARVGLFDRAAGVEMAARGIGCGAVGIVGDVLDEAGIAGAVTGLGGHVDILVNNAGIELTAGAETTTSDDWDRVMAVNVKGVLLASRSVLAGMRARGGGAIVNVASISGLLGWLQTTAYCTSKGAVVQLTRQLAVEFGPMGVRVNAVCPGTTETPMLERLLADMGDAQEARRSIADMHPLGRFAEPREIAEAIVFLASPEASFITATAIPCDGGFLGAQIYQRDD